MRKFWKTILCAVVGLTIGLALRPAQAQVHPQMVSDVDVFKMEDEAEKVWQAALPRLGRETIGQSNAWDRLQSRLRDAKMDWEWAKKDISPWSVYRKYDEMWQWCMTMTHEKMPADTGQKAAQRFAQLDVRVRLCEEKVPKPKSVKK